MSIFGALAGASGIARKIWTRFPMCQSIFGALAGASAAFAAPYFASSYATRRERPSKISSSVPQGARHMPVKLLKNIGCERGPDFARHRGARATRRIFKDLFFPALGGKNRVFDRPLRVDAATMAMICHGVSGMATLPKACRRSTPASVDTQTQRLRGSRSAYSTPAGPIVHP